MDLKEILLTVATIGAIGYSTKKEYDKNYKEKDEDDDEDFDY